jgi:hypothetical protein
MFSRPYVVRKDRRAKSVELKTLQCSRQLFATPGRQAPEHDPKQLEKEPFTSRA